MSHVPDLSSQQPRDMHYFFAHRFLPQIALSDPEGFTAAVGSGAYREMFPNLWRKMSREFELAEEGFIAVTMRKGSDNAAYFSANSCQKPKFFGTSKEGKEAELNYKLGLQLPYMFVISRLAHYIKVIQRENIGSWKERGDLERELNNWIRQYVAVMDNPAPGVRSRRPLRKAQVEVTDVPGEPGWYKVSFKVRPHFKYMGASFELSLVGKLDKD